MQFCNCNSIFNRSGKCKNTLLPPVCIPNCLRYGSNYVYPDFCSYSCNKYIVRTVRMIFIIEIKSDTPDELLLSYSDKNSSQLMHPPTFATPVEMNRAVLARNPSI